MRKQTLGARSLYGVQGRGMDRRQKLEVYGPNRRCGDKLCIKILSQYNPGPNCFQHAPRKIHLIKGGRRLQNDRP